MPTSLNVGQQPRVVKMARGAFVNTAEANCSIFESGRMVYECLKHSPLYEMEYYSIDAFDVSLFNETGRLKRKQNLTEDPDSSFDFYIFNWHFVTMASDIDPAAISRLAVPKFSVVLELAPGEPLMLMPKGVFDGYIALDPSIADDGTIYAFPRPLEMEGRKGRPFTGDKPVIGSFGFGTPAKGFELLIEAVNREFEKAVVRINIPHGKYVETDVIHRMQYSKRLNDVCQKIANPGIDVIFTSEFLSPEQLVDWCQGNDLNCFMYTRALPGLSATTDQCIISGQPLLTLTNDTFRHIHRYIEPYPYQGLRQAIADSGKQIETIQHDWSKERFLQLFHRVLDKHGVVSSPGIPPMKHARQNSTPIVVISRYGQSTDSLFDYPQKIANAIGRSRQQQIIHLSYAEAAVRLANLPHPPSGAVLVDYDLGGRMQVEAAMRRLNCPKVIVPEAGDDLRPIEYPVHWGEVVVFPRMPIVPFHTNSVGLRDPRTVILLGFSRSADQLAYIVRNVLSQLEQVEILIEAGHPETAPGGKQPAFALAPGQRIATVSFAPGDASVITRFGESALIIANNDTARTRELETLVSLAMITERPVVFTRASPFPGLLDRGTYVEDHAISDLIEMGLSAHIKPLYDFGEWTMATSLRRVLDGTWRRALANVPKNSIPILSPQQALQIAALGSRARVDGGSDPVRAHHTKRIGTMTKLLTRLLAARHFHEADNFRDERRWREAADRYRAGLAIAPAQAEYWVQYGHVTKEAGDLQTAETAYANALRLMPDDADLSIQLGHFYKQRGEPALMRIFYNRARELGSRDQHARPAETGSQAVPLRNADDARAFFARGDLHRDANAWTDAAQAYSAGLSLRPDALGYWIQLGNVLKEAGDLIGAEHAYDSALRLSPLDKDLNLQFGHLLLKLGRADQAQNHYHTAVSSGSRDKHAIAAIAGHPDRQSLLRDAIYRTAGQSVADGSKQPPASFNREILRAHALLKSK